MEKDDNEGNISSTSKIEDSNKRSATDAFESSSPEKRLAVENNASSSNSGDSPSSSVVKNNVNPQSDQKADVTSAGSQSSASSSASSSSSSSSSSSAVPLESSFSVIATEPVRETFDNAKEESSQKADLNEIFKEILLKNVEIAPIGEGRDEPAISDEVPCQSDSHSQLHSAKIKVDIAEADTSFIESSDSSIDPQEVASSSLNALEELARAYNEPCDDRKEADVDLGEASRDETTKRILEPESKATPDSDSSRKFKDDALGKPEDFSAIEDALKSMISDIEHSNLEPLSFDTRDLKDDFLNDKVEEVSSSCGIEFQPDAFLVSSTSEDTADLPKDTHENDPDPCSSKNTCFKGAISNDFVSASNQNTLDDKLMEEDSNYSDDRIDDFMADTTDSTSVNYQERVEIKDDNENKFEDDKPSSDSVSTTNKDENIMEDSVIEKSPATDVVEEVAKDNIGSLILSEEGSTSSLHGTSDVSLMQKDTVSESEPVALSNEKFSEVNLNMDDLTSNFERGLASSPNAEDKSHECGKNKAIVTQIKESESQPSRSEEDCSNIISNVMADDLDCIKDLTSQEHEKEVENKNSHVSDNTKTGIISDATVASIGDENSQERDQQRSVESSSHQIEEGSPSIIPERDISIEHDDKPDSSTEKPSNDSEVVMPEGIMEEKGTAGDISLPRASVDAPFDSASECKDPTPSRLSSEDGQGKRSTFAEPLKAIVNEDAEMECADSSTAISVGSADNIDSFAATPCDSGETSSLSTPAGSCQVSAAPSPLSKPLEDEPNLVSGLLDDNSLDCKYMDDDSRDNISHAEKKPLKGASKKKDKAKSLKRKDPVILDEETRMDAGSNGISDIPMDEDSQGSLNATSKKKVRSFRCEVIVPESTELFTANKVAEYMWPLEGFGEHYFIQEHISQYLGIMSFKRKYPDLRRRPIESQEKEYLKDNGFVNEMACDLGLTAVRSEDAFDVMFNDFPSKYEELQKILRERKEMQLKEKGKVDYQMMNLDKSKLQEYGRKAAHDAARWNIALNRERKDERRYIFDLQTFTVHKPISLCKKVPMEVTKIGSYPVAVLPGQYTDVSREYSPAELRCMPLQTVLSGPFTTEELNADTNAAVSDEENGPTSVGTCSNEKEVVVEKEIEGSVTEAPLAEKQIQPRCKECSGTRERNRHGKPEPLIICGSCRSPSHPTCIELTLSMIEKIESYSWQCMECKTCAQCNDPDDEERMIFCDMCDRGYHIYCVGLRRVPQGRWHCKECAFCFSCGSRTPSGNEHIKNAEWQHEYKKEKDVKQLKYACTLCVPCDKYWKRRQFCYVCMKVYRSIPEDGMVKCTGCPKYVHREGCSTVQDNERYCTYCFKTRNKTALNHSRIIAAAKKKMASGY